MYDSQSRRIAETVDNTTTVYIYDGWNPIAEYSTTFALTKTYTWGLDLSGSMQGAGGVVGLLAVTDGTGTYYPTFDGNGNVSEYLDSNGITVAHYEYDPFGKITVSNGSKASEFSHRFSTKPLDLTTKLYYYGYRFYDPETGRWPSRDPIEEAGGVNLYGFVGNDGVNWMDLLGLSELSSEDYQKEIRRLIDSNTLNPDDIFVGLLKKYLAADKEGDWCWDCQDDMEEIFSALSAILGQEMKFNHNDPDEPDDEKRFRKVRNWLAGTEYRNDPATGKPFEINGRPRLFLSNTQTNPSNVFGRRGDAMLHFLRSSSNSSNWGETVGDLLGTAKEVKDGAANVWQDGNQDFLNHDGYSEHDQNWNQRGTDLQNDFDTYEGECRKLVKAFVAGTHTMSNYHNTK